MDYNYRLMWKCNTQLNSRCIVYEFYERRLIKNLTPIYPKKL